MNAWSERVQQLLKAARMDAGLSAKVMGAEMGKSTRSIQRIENGEVEAKGEDITRWMDICDHDWSIDAAPRT